MKLVCSYTKYNYLHDCHLCIGMWRDKTKFSATKDGLRSPNAGLFIFISF